MRDLAALGFSAAIGPEHLNPFFDSVFFVISLKLFYERFPSEDLLYFTSSRMNRIDDREDEET